MAYLPEHPTLIDLQKYMDEVCKEQGWVTKRLPSRAGSNIPAISKSPGLQMGLGDMPRLAHGGRRRCFAQRRTRVPGRGGPIIMGRLKEGLRLQRAVAKYDAIDEHRSDEAMRR